jgi:hypothetical protein
MQQLISAGDEPALEMAAKWRGEVFARFAKK